MIGAVETGGTKFRVAFLDDDLEIVDELRIPTTTPSATLAASVDFLEAGPPLRGIGIAAFGPITLDGPDRGLMGMTPKPGWKGARLLDGFRGLGDVPIGLDTDVGAAAIAEMRIGAGRDVDSLFYVTVGTGIGGSYVESGMPHHGHGHSEIGHLPTPRVAGDTFVGLCPFHRDCVEGMASGTAFDARRAASQADAAEYIATYLGQLVASITYSFAPHRVVFGGGVMNAEGMINALRAHAHLSIAGYSSNPQVVDSISTYVVPADLGQDAGLLGAGLLGLAAAGEAHR